MNTAAVIVHVADDRVVCGRLLDTLRAQTLDGGGHVFTAEGDARSAEIGAAANCDLSVTIWQA